eukprot:TRINITY_DN27868_c0_g1_i1.p1 TRINITY_DN27868_c0_g1~~TRINITY_DN27868_c0_g1_i1.p1  ORF type:complete len:104 (+),score=7.33 TRINITY_DN27868_c0_g1_i1:265-576(+)
MPTFSPNELQIADYQTLLDELTKQRGKLLNAKTVVLDLRHNQGGSSFLEFKKLLSNYGENTLLTKSERNMGAIRQVWVAGVWKKILIMLESLKVLLKEQTSNV